MSNEEQVWIFVTPLNDKYLRISREDYATLMRILEEYGATVHNHYLEEMH